MKLKANLGDKVKGKANSKTNSPKANGELFGMFLKSHLGGYANFKGDIVYQIKTASGQVFTYQEEDIEPIKVQILHAYIDSTDEVHWSTRKYSSKELDNFGFREAFQYNKTIELE